MLAGPNGPPAGRCATRRRLRSGSASGRVRGAGRSLCSIHATVASPRDETATVMSSGSVPAASSAGGPNGAPGSWTTAATQVR